MKVASLRRWMCSAGTAKRLNPMQSGRPIIHNSAVPSPHNRYPALAFSCGLAILIACTTTSARRNEDRPSKSWRHDSQVSSQAIDFVRELTDTAGPRLAGSAGDKTAREWALATMRRIGLSEVREQPVRFKRWHRGEEVGQIVFPTLQKLSLTALGGSIGTSSPIEAEVVEFEGLDEIAKSSADAVSHKIVFFNLHTERARDGSGYGKAVAIRSRGPSEAAKMGAVAVVIRSVGTDTNRLPHTGAMRQSDGGPSVPAAALSAPDADLLHRLVARERSVRLRISLGCGWGDEVESANVIGEVRGSDKSQQIVVLGAHLDSWDLGTGALDDGAGVGIALEIARLSSTSGDRPRRTLRVVLFANEENGLSGGRTYAERAKGDLFNHVAALEADSGTGRAYALRYLGAPAGAEFVQRAIIPQLKPLDVQWSDAPAHGGADFGPLRDLGVPVLDVQQDASMYFDIHHTANDTFDKIDGPALAQATAAYAIVVDVLLKAEFDFGRAPPAPPGPRF